MGRKQMEINRECGDFKNLETWDIGLSQIVQWRGREIEI